MREIVKRSEVRTEDTWRVEDLYPVQKQWEQEAEQLRVHAERMEGYRGRLGSGAEVLLAGLKELYAGSLLLDRLTVYAFERFHEDTSDTGRQALTNAAQNLAVAWNSAVSFVTPEILTISAGTLAEFRETEPELADFDRVLEKMLRNRPYTLNAETERLLSLSQDVADGASNIFDMFQDADLTFEPAADANGKTHEMSNGRFISYQESPDRTLRKNAFLSMYRAYGKFRNTLAAVYFTNVKADLFYAGARGFSSGRAQSLHYSEIPEAVYDNLLSAVREHLPAMHRYVSLRKRALGVSELHMYDVYAPLIPEEKNGRGTAACKEIPFEEAKEMVLRGLAPLGEEYAGILKEGFENRWIDIYENKGKHSGAYSWGAYGTHPYVLLNYGERLDDVFTLAHEMGHALHTYYSNVSQPYHNSQYELFVAEVASTCNEALLIRYLLGKAEDVEERAYLVNHFLDKFKGTLFRQTMFAEFEYKAHRMAEQGEALSAESLGSLYHALNEAYFGPEMVIDPELDVEWSRIPHFYTSFYVYQYATGFSAAIALAERILKEGAPAVEDYKRFLKGGCSASPIELLKLAGVDSSEEGPIRAALDLFAELVEELDGLLDGRESC